MLTEARAAMPPKTCYMCEAPETSREHAPPQCLFPEQKDTPDRFDYRKNLITVPSCEKHNSLKSQDDEYLLHVLTGSYTSSTVGLNQFITKVGRSFVRSPSKASSLTGQSTLVQLMRVGDPEWNEGLQVVVDAERLDLVLGNCARALYFHETLKKFAGPVQVITGFTMYNDADVQASVTAMLAAAESVFSNNTAKGENPDIFWYKFAEGENIAFFLMCFYSHSEVIVKLNKRENAKHVARERP